MRYSVLTLLSLASAALAQWDPTDGFNVVSKPSFDEVIPAGKAYDIEWAPTAEFPEAITIKVYGGKARDNLDLVATIASGVDSAEGTYSWDVPADLGSAVVYGIRIESETNSTRFQWGNPFTIKAGKPSTSATASGSASATETKTTVTSTKATETKTSVETKTTLTTTFSANTSTTAPAETTVTSTLVEEEEETSTTAAATSTSTAIPTGAGVRALGDASSFALLGGVALAVLAF
ncbi:Ser-Thr-rich glycosyl-phosphatidyl-inositol-anchored membrane family-domain-containing protein [Triangularia setosa]|uniref:Ser-Thr-rich glycosyl-phosphatidyl-inositol-anchored membrane family-domain-containing protein n=1 Tax=Triangularia setosa TaxID=2587417 RepID=A0AAN6WJL9_9PEZI|nr:Ser-Thr-rich glycosyl-phosphatidyl-inositol-anchored membrane family-domain-containing protein [Podospora setosa]